jgi:hypothetical protein
VEATELARLQCALLAAVHFLFVLLTLGLGPDDGSLVGAPDDRPEPEVAR